MTAGEAGGLRPLAIGLVGALAMFGIGFRRAPAPPPPAPSVTLRVPHARGPMTVDGETDEPDWTRAPARTGAFLAADGSAARPASEARLLWDDAFLYLSLYAADEDIRAAKVAPDGPVWSGDSFSVELGSADGVKYTLAVGPSGIVTDAALRPGQPADEPGGMDDRAVGGEGRAQGHDGGQGAGAGLTGEQRGENSHGTGPVGTRRPVWRSIALEIEYFSI